MHTSDQSAVAQAPLTPLVIDHLARTLRLLVTNHIFVEVSPDTFAHNRISSVLDTGKPIEEILVFQTPSPKKKHVGTHGITAAVGHFSDEAMKCLSYLSEAIMDPVSGHANDVRDVAYNRAFRRKDVIWDLFDEPGQEYRVSRFGSAMDGTKNMAPPNAACEGFDWKGLGENALVVDVGGGIGAQSLDLARAFPNLKFIIQDREPICRVGEKHWDSEIPSARRLGRVQFQEHNFYDAQPVKNADVFYMRMIMHDYPDKICITILKHLRAAAKPTTQLVITDNVIAYACEESSANTIPGAARELPPAPLLANYGQANIVPYLMDIHMMGILGGRERTVTQFREILEASGWKLARVHYGAPFVLSNQKLIAVPA